MGSNQLDVQWTNSMLLNVVENYVVRPNFSRFSDGEHFGDLQSKEVFNSKQALKIIKKLYEKDSGLSVYGPAEKLMEDLVTIQYFPNNAKFLGLTDEYNYFGYPRYLVDKSGGEFMSKMDVFMVIYRNFTNAYDDGNEIANLILMKWGNQIGKKLKTSFEIIPGCLVDAVISSCSDFYKNHANEIANGKLCRKFRFSKYNVDELYARFSKHFDESTDAHLLKQLKQQLTAYSKRVPIKVNQKFYQRVYIKLVLYEESTKHLLKQFPTIFTPNVPCFGDYNVATTRMLKDGDDTFFFAKELQEAVKAGFIDKYEGRKMPRDDTNIVVETNEERMNKGIIYTVSMDEFEKLLGKFKITNRDVSVIENDYKKTSRQIGVPLISPYGSHCKTATDAFFEVFDHISTGMKVFQAVSEENLPKVFEFFEKLPFIISNHQDKYMVTTAKIGESVDLAYQQLAQYVTEPIYELPKDKLLFTEDEAREEINKLSPNLPLNQENLKFVLFYRRKQVGGCRNLSIRDVFEVFEHCLRLQFFLLNPKFAEFMHNQRACQVYPRFQCHCFSKANKAPKSIRSLENLTASHVQAIHIKYNNTLRYQIFTNSAKKFYDNETCLQKSLDVSLDSVRGENRELISLIYEAQNIKLASEAKRFFYLSEFEMDGLVGQFAHRFVTGIKFSNDRLENQKDDLHQTTVIRWEEIHKSLRDFFPEQTKYEELFEKIKENLRNRKCAKGGIRGNYVSAIMDILRQAQMNFGRIWNTLKSLTDFQCWNPHRTIQLRILTAIRVDDQKTWHLFSEEVLEALKCVLRAEKRLHLVREKIENWEMEWFNSQTYTTIDVEQFEKILEILQIDKSKFVLVPDAQVIRQFNEIPLKMSYNCMEIVGPDGIMVCHWMQAQYLLFQHLVADVNCSKHKKIRKQVMEILKNMESGYYISLEELEIIIKNFKTEKSIYLRKVNLETPLTIIHNNKFDEMIPRTFFMDLLQIITEEYFLEEPGGGGEFEFLARMFLNWLKIEGDLKEIESWKARYVLMNYWISNFFGDKEKDTRCNILFAFTVSLPFVKLPNAKTLKMWKVSILEGENCCVEYSRMNQCVENMKICQKTNKNFKWTDLVRIHEKGASFIASNPRKEALMKKLIEDKDKKTTEEVLDKIVEKFTENVLPFIKEEGEFRKIGKLGELIRKKMDKEYIDGFEEIMKSCKGLAKLEERLGVFLDFKILNFKEHFYKRKDIIVELERLKFAGNLEN